MRPATPRPVRFALLALTVALAGCASVKFYAQAVSGQAALLLSRRDIQALMDSDDTEPALAAQLRLVAAMRRFAAEELALPVGERYASYADVGSVAIWNVVAAHELQLAAHSRCYPLIGCVVYRGYFSRDAAEAEGRRLAASHDVHVYPVGAYSTLGWFDDPVLSSFIHYRQTALAELLFHELAHGVVYVRGDSAFNESYATFVGRRGAKAWFAAQGRDAETASKAQAERDASTRFAAFLRDWRDRLRALYALPISDDAMRQLKAAAFAAMRAAYHSCREHLGNGSYDDAMRRPFNNARMVLVGTYDDLGDRFARLFDAVGGSWPAFHRRVQALGALSAEERRRELPSAPEAAMPNAVGACAA